jgi:hypothetical protein
VGGFQFTWDGASSGNVEIAGVVPEPSTWALIGLAAAVFGGRVLAKRRR